MKIKVSDYIANFYLSKGIDKAFVLTGGCIIHVIDSIGTLKGIDYVPMLHEQSAAMAADAYARVTGKPGLIAVTSGPGATNLLTGICCSYYDSIPVIAITGQVPTNYLKQNIETRQLGFQETDVVSIFKSVTKYSKLIENAKDIRYELEKSYYIANTGRKGPVLLDICENVLFSYVNEKELNGFSIEHEKLENKFDEINTDLIYEEIVKSNRPILVLGGGVRNSVEKKELLKLVDKLSIPVMLTWGGFDLIDHNHRLFAGGFGVTSPRSGNFNIQNADLIISIGTRFDTHEIGTKPETFARNARKIVVDIDQGEINKYKDIGLKIDISVLSPADLFIDSMLLNNKYIIKENLIWREKIKEWKNRYPICTKSHIEQKKYVNPYAFFNVLEKYIPNNSVVVTDCGSNLIWTMQSLSLKNNQQVISAFNHSPMGYSMAASIGAAIAEPERTIVCIIGDGGFYINVQELAVISKHKLKIKIFVMNNHCHGIIQGTQNAWLEGRHHASSPDYGMLPDPNITKIGLSYDIKTINVDLNEKINEILNIVFSNSDPELINLHMLQENQIEPKLMHGRPIEDSHPLLSREELSSNMLIPIIDIVGKI